MKIIDKDLDYHTIISLVFSFLDLCVIMNIFAWDGSLPSIFFIAYHVKEGKKDQFKTNKTTNTVGLTSSYCISPKVLVHVVYTVENFVLLIFTTRKQRYNVGQKSTYSSI